MNHAPQPFRDLRNHLHQSQEVRNKSFTRPFDEEILVKEIVSIQEELIAPIRELFFSQLADDYIEEKKDE